MSSTWFARANECGGNTTSTSGHWSVFVNLNGLTSYNTSTSYYFLLSDHVAPQPSTGHAAEVRLLVLNGRDRRFRQPGRVAGRHRIRLLLQRQHHGSTTAAYYSACIECYRYPENRICLPVSPGDNMSVEVWNTSSTNGCAYVETINFDRNDCPWQY